MSIQISEELTQEQKEEAMKIFAFCSEKGRILSYKGRFSEESIEEEVFYEALERRVGPVVANLMGEYAASNYQEIPTA